MRRAARILLNVVTVLSAVLAVAAVALWLRAQRVGDRVAYTPDRRISSRGSEAWTVGLIANTDGVAAWYSPPPSHFLVRGFEHWTRDPEPDTVGSLWQTARVAGVRFSRSPILPGEWEAFAPFGHVVALFAALPLVRGYRRYRRGPRRRPGHCAACGYDLRATPNQCPECGEVPKAVIA